MAAQILELAKRLVRQEQQIQQLTREHRETFAEYQKLVGQLSNGRGEHEAPVIEQPLVAEPPLRQRIYSYLKQNAGVRLHLAEIERAVGISTEDEREHRRMIWTLSNMRRDSVVRREGRGLWMVSKEDVAEEYAPTAQDDDIPF